MVVNDQKAQPSADMSVSRRVSLKHRIEFMGFVVAGVALGLRDDDRLERRQTILDLANLVDVGAVGDDDFGFGVA